MIIINLLSIVVSIVVVYDIYQLPQKIKVKLHDRLYGKNKPYEPYEIKPFDCSVCTTFWITLFYTIYLGFGVYSFPLAGTLTLLNILINRYIL